MTQGNTNLGESKYIHNSGAYLLWDTKHEFPPLTTHPSDSHWYCCLSIEFNWIVLILLELTVFAFIVHAINYWQLKMEKLGSAAFRFIVISNR